MTRKTALLLLLPLIGTLNAQEKDQGIFVPYDNAFYEEIKKGLNEQSTTEKEQVKVFRMDLGERTIPASPGEFKTVWCHNPISQGRTGTCWCFSTSSFYESEIFRLSGEKIKLSELYIVYWEYVEKAREFIRTRGSSFFGEGSETNAVARMMKKYGMLPRAVYSGMQLNQKFHDHKAMYKEMKQHLESRKRDNSWNEADAVATIKSILNYHLGEPPASFSYNGKSMTPQLFLKDIAKLNPDDYVNFMSLKMHPYYQNAIYDVPDNWWKSDDYYNVPLDDFMDAIKNAVKNGYSISIGGDVSESGYNAENDVAMVPTYDIPSEFIDENARQFRFSNGSTTDDHAIHLMGWLEKDGSTWFLIKDSGSGARNGKHPGYYFYHEDYVKLKIMSFTVHKDAVKELLKKIEK